ncbi:hypothetical protein HK098_005569, partial [Nowakowskiella sp. JEL0407]
MKTIIALQFTNHVEFYEFLYTPNDDNDTEDVNYQFNLLHRIPDIYAVCISMTTFEAAIIKDDGTILLFNYTLKRAYSITYTYSSTLAFFSPPIPVHLPQRQSFPLYTPLQSLDGENSVDEMNSKTRAWRPKFDQMRDFEFSGCPKCGFLEGLRIECITVEALEGSDDEKYVKLHLVTKEGDFLQYKFKIIEKMNLGDEMIEELDDRCSVCGRKVIEEVEIHEDISDDINEMQDDIFLNEDKIHNLQWCKFKLVDFESVWNVSNQILNLPAREIKVPPEALPGMSTLHEQLLKRYPIEEPEYNENNVWGPRYKPVGKFSVSEDVLSGYETLYTEQLMSLFDNEKLLQASRLPDDGIENIPAESASSLSWLLSDIHLSTRISRNELELKLSQSSSTKIPAEFEPTVLTQFEETETQSEGEEQSLSSYFTQITSSEIKVPTDLYESVFKSWNDDEPSMSSLQTEPLLIGLRTNKSGSKQIRPTPSQMKSSQQTKSTYDIYKERMSQEQKQHESMSQFLDLLGSQQQSVSVQSSVGVREDNSSTSPNRLTKRVSKLSQGNRYDDIFLTPPTVSMSQSTTIQKSQVEKQKSPSKRDRSLGVRFSSPNITSFSQPEFGGSGMEASQKSDVVTSFSLPASGGVSSTPNRVPGDYKSVFWDEKEIQLTEDWKATFLARLELSSLFIPLISASTLDTFGDSGDADNVLLEWDIAIDRYEKNELKILPLFILESGQNLFDFKKVVSHSTPALGCKRTFDEIWAVFKRLKGFMINFEDEKDLRLFELGIASLAKNISMTSTKLNISTNVSKSINLPRCFVGREDDLAKIGAFLSDDNKRRSVVFHGGPGMGKTTIASKFALQADSQYTHILWISLVSDATFIDSVSKACKQLGLPQDNDTDKQKSMVFDWLETHNGYLLILDNADDSVLVRKCLDGISRFAGHVIITTRNSIIDQYIPLGMENIDIHHQELKFWDKPTSKAYVVSRLAQRMESITEDETAALDKILDYSEGYPLAIEQFCSYLSVERSVTFTALLGTLDVGNTDEVWKQTLLSGASNYQRTLDAVVDIALSSLQNNGHDEACVLLAGIAHASKKDIPIHTYLARFLSNAGFTKNVHKALTPIIEMSLITVDSRNAFVSIHLATQEVLRRNLSSLKIGSSNDKKTPLKLWKPKPANSYVDRSPTVVEPSPATTVDWIDLAFSSMSELIPLEVKDSYERSAFEVGITLFPHIPELSKTSIKRTTKFGELCYSAARLADFYCSYAHARNLFTIAIESF